MKENSYIGIVGNNTSGKTTLTKLIAGILPSKDSIIIGYSYVNDKRFQDHSKELGIVFGNSLNHFYLKMSIKKWLFL